MHEPGAVLQVGDQTGLFPISFLQRALYNNDLTGGASALQTHSSSHSAACLHLTYAAAF